jgi:hypothetical protein
MALPGTPCVTSLNQLGTWNAGCLCVANAVGCQACIAIQQLAPFTADIASCSAFGAAPFTYLWEISDGATSSDSAFVHSFNQPGTYSACLSLSDAVGCSIVVCDTIYVDANGGISSNPSASDCMGILNGPNQPGTPCWLFGSNTLGIWDAACDCIPGTSTNCQAGFWAMQAFEWDSLGNPNGVGDPIPYEIWVWNLSSGTGGLTYAWDFGDGSTSTLAYPTHTYSGNGPYLLCLTISDGIGCTDQFCDSVSIDGDGILEGLVLEHGSAASGARQDGFTVNVQNPLTTGVSDASALRHAALWPNPASGDLNLALVSLAPGNVDITIHDVNGRLVQRDRLANTVGRNQYGLSVAALHSGVYTLRAVDGQGKAISLRFVKQ